MHWEQLEAKYRKRIAELEAAMLAVILAYDDNDDSPDPERALSDAIQAARAVYGKRRS